MVANEIVTTMVTLATGVVTGGAGAAFWTGFFKRNTDRADAANAISQGAVGLLTRADKEITKLETENDQLKAIASPLVRAVEDMLPFLEGADPARVEAWRQAATAARLAL